jgi:hypothetical protein
MRWIFRVTPRVSIIVGQGCFSCVMHLISMPLLTVLGIGTIWLLYWRLSQFPATQNILAGLACLPSGPSSSVVG